MDLSVIIVSFNTKEKLAACLQRVFGSRTNFDYEVFVVDNHSTDDSPDMVRSDFDRAKLIQNPENSGYAKANNQALSLASGRYVLLLNPDIEVGGDSFDKMISFMDNNRMVGIAGCKVLKSDGKLDLACRRSFPNPANSLFRVTGLSFLFPKTRLANYNLSYLPEDKIAEVDSVMGAFLMARREVVSEIGLLDEDFFMYGEDLDFCFRAKRAGFAVMYVPITSVIHHKGSSSRKVVRLALYEFHRAMQIFYDKHYKQEHGSAFNFMIRAGIWLRYALKLFINSLRSEKYVSR